ncbi:MAG: hypothetical protein ACP5XB_20425, partial [Isosphaeraceae bacterium]
IDGKPAPIYRVNRMMRGAAVAAGKHKLVYFYDPLSFRIGLVVSVVGLVVLAFLCGGCSNGIRPRAACPGSGERAAIFRFIPCPKPDKVLAIGRPAERES